MYLVKNYHHKESYILFPVIIFEINPSLVLHHGK